MSNRQHFDATGRLCHSWFDLKEIVTHEPSRTILTGHMLFQVRIHPFIAIRVPKPFCGFVELIHYGTGNKSEVRKELAPRSIEALRRLYKNARSRGWLVEDGKNFVIFTRLARVTIDPLRRWTVRS